MTHVYIVHIVYANFSDKLSQETKINKTGSNANCEYEFKLLGKFKLLGHPYNIDDILSFVKNRKVFLVKNF